MNKVRLGDIADIKLGKMLDSKKNRGEFYPYLANIHVRWGDFDLENLPRMRFEASELERFSLNDGDLVMCEGGEPGRCAIWRNQLSGVHYQKALHRIRPHENTADVRWLYYWFLLQGRIGGLKKYFIETTIKHLVGEDLKQVEIDLPEFDYQVRIADVLSSIDDRIALNKRTMAELEDTGRLIYDYWFTQFDFPDENGKPYRSSGGKMVYNETLNREIPEGWEVTTIGEQCELRLGGTPDTSIEKFWDGDMPWLNSAEVAASPILKAEKSITQAGMKESATSFAPAGSILLSITRYIRPSILAIDACFNQSVVAILENRILHSEYLYPFVQSQVPRYLVLRTGAQQPHINKETVGETPFCIPTESVLEHYYDKTSPLFKQLISIAKEAELLSSLRDWLLPMLINGQVSIDA